MADRMRLPHYAIGRIMLIVLSVGLLAPLMWTMLPLLWGGSESAAGNLLAASSVRLVRFQEPAAARSGTLARHLRAQDPAPPVADPLAWFRHGWGDPRADAGSYLAFVKSGGLSRRHVAPTDPAGLAGPTPETLQTAAARLESDLLERRWGDLADDLPAFESSYSALAGTVLRLPSNVDPDLFSDAVATLPAAFRFYLLASAALLVVVFFGLPWRWATAPLMIVYFILIFHGLAVIHLDLLPWLGRWLPAVMFMPFVAAALAVTGQVLQTNRARARTAYGYLEYLPELHAALADQAAQGLEKMLHGPTPAAMPAGGADRPPSDGAAPGDGATASPRGGAAMSPAAGSPRPELGNSSLGELTAPPLLVGLAEVRRRLQEARVEAERRAEVQRAEREQARLAVRQQIEQAEQSLADDQGRRASRLLSHADFTYRSNEGRRRLRLLRRRLRESERFERDEQRRLRAFRRPLLQPVNTLRIIEEHVAEVFHRPHFPAGHHEDSDTINALRRRQQYLAGRRREVEHLAAKVARLAQRSECFKAAKPAKLDRHLLLQERTALRLRTVEAEVTEQQMALGRIRETLRLEIEALTAFLAAAEESRTVVTTLRNRKIVRHSFWQRVHDELDDERSQAVQQVRLKQLALRITDPAQPPGSWLTFWRTCIARRPRS